MQLTGGLCGMTRVINQPSVALMQVDRADEFGTPYGMGWFILANEDESGPTIFWDSGAFGSIAWIDTRRMVGGLVAIDDYTTYYSPQPIALTLTDIIPLVAQAVDEARAAISSD